MLPIFNLKIKPWQRGILKHKTGWIAHEQWHSHALLEQSDYRLDHCIGKHKWNKVNRVYTCFTRDQRIVANEFGRENLGDGYCNEN